MIIGDYFPSTKSLKKNPLQSGFRRNNNSIRTEMNNNRDLMHTLNNDLYDISQDGSGKLTPSDFKVVVPKVKMTRQIAVPRNAKNCSSLTADVF